MHECENARMYDDCWRGLILILQICNSAIQQFSKYAIMEKPNLFFISKKPIL